MVAPAVAHVVLNTHRYEEMIDWYTGVLEARVQHRDNRLAFLTYDDEHHRFAFFNLGLSNDSNGDLPTAAAGLNHLAYTWRNLEELMDTSRERSSCSRRLAPGSARPSTGDAQALP